MNICVYGASSDLIDPSYIQAGEQLGEIIAKSGHSVVFGGGAHGMMGAVARGAKRQNGQVFGITPHFFNVDGILYDRCTDITYTDGMHERKKLLEDRSDAFIVTPGGVGTYDELFEVLCLRQLNQHRKPILIFNVNGYFDIIRQLLEHTAKQGFMKPQNLNLLIWEDDPIEAVKKLEIACRSDKPDTTVYR